MWFKRLEAWASFIPWYLCVLLEPSISRFRSRVSLAFCDARLSLLRFLRGDAYPFTLLRREVVEAFKSEKGLERIAPTPIQMLAIPRILKGRSVLITAPTGSGKTEAAFLPILHRLLEDKERAEREGKGWPRGVHVLYITPLRALCSDIAARLERYVRAVLPFYCCADAWHSDVEEAKKRQMEENPPTVLVTTPESLESILDRVRNINLHLKNLKCVIIDEVHELVDSKRGHQLLILLERLKYSLGIGRLQRVLISATVADPARIARMFGGSDGPVEVICYPRVRRMRVSVVFRPSADEVEAARALSDFVGREKSLVFVNTRAEAEQIHAGLEKLGIGDFGVHHGSLSPKVRQEVESKFRGSGLRAIVCTRTLELGIDIGSVGKVVQVGSPSLPEALAQRLGRSAHKPGEEARGVVLCLETADILETLALLSMLSRGRLAAEARLPACLDVVARAIAAIALQKQKCEAGGSPELSIKVPARVDEAFTLIKLAGPYRGLTRSSLERVLRELVGRSVVNLDSSTNTLRLGESFKIIWRGKHYGSFFSMIPEKEYIVVRYGKEKIGEIDPVNLRFIRVGSVIRLAGENWRVVKIEREVFVEKALGERYTVPVWKGGYFMTPRAVSIETCRILSWLLKTRASSAADRVSPYLPPREHVALELDGSARETIEELLREIAEKRLPLPGPRLMIVEKFSVEEMTLDRFLEGVGASKAAGRSAVSVFLYPFGERISNTLASPLWGSGKARLIVPKSLGILVKHSSEFDPYAYLLSVSKDELRQCIENPDNPYILALSYEMRRSFGYTRLKKALKSDLVRNESVNQAFARFYDVEGASRLLEWIRHGCVKVIRREVKSVKELHPLTIYLFRADTFTYR
ncbi:MAG: DEAD/DEAH box helicase [Thermofilaceae archaeon]